MINDLNGVNDPEMVHDKVLSLEDEIMPVITKIRDAITTFDKFSADEDEDAIERIEALEYFKNEISPVINWIDKYMRYNEELRDMFIGAEIKKQLKSVLNGAESSNKQLVSLKEKVSELNCQLKAAQEEGDHYYDDLCNYYDKWNNMTLKDWFKIKVLSKFKSSHKQ